MPQTNYKQTFNAPSILSAASGSNNYSAFSNATFTPLTSNSIVLTPGTWRVHTYFAFYSGGSGVNGLYATSGLYGANGAGISTAPVSVASLSSIASVIGPTNFDNNLAPATDIEQTTQTVSGQGQNQMTTPVITVVTVTANTTVYAVPKIYSSSNQGFFRAYVQAEKIGA